MAGNDSSLLAIASKGPVDSYLALAGRLRALDAELDSGDGLVWFNRWYIALMAALVESARRHGFDDAYFIERLECHAAERYFEALTAHLGDPGSGASCWEPLFRARSRADVLPIQHALAGINAHVNHDLPIALVVTCAETEQAPARDAPAYADYHRLGAIIDNVLCDTRAWLAPGGRPAAGPGERQRHLVPVRTHAGAGDRATADPASDRGQLEEALSIWSSKRACEAAWAAAEVRWALRVSPLISRHHLEALDRLVGLAGRSLLQPWQLSSTERRPSSTPNR